jgi:GNAT superfamily N-acetyltransferase
MTPGVRSTIHLGDPTALEWQGRGFLVSTDKTRLDTALVCDYLSGISYWALGRPPDLIARSIDNSLCFGLFRQSEQIGFARVVTDRATFAWLADVFVLPQHRGQGLGTWLVQCVVSHPELQTVKQFMLATRDAQEFYRRSAAFEVVPDAGHLMVRRRAQAPHRPGA